MTIIYFLIALGVLIFIHELGHFIMAKRAGVRVDEFSLGFGKRLIGFKKGETDYRISLLPFGGYVKMLGEGDGNEEIDDPKSYAKKTVLQRFSIVCFGPLMNLFFAFLVMPLVFFIGRTEPAFLNDKPVLMGVQNGSLASIVDLKKDDLIKSINGKTVNQWGDVLNHIAISSGSPINIDVERNGNILTRTINPSKDKKVKEPFIGIEPTFFLGQGIIVNQVMENSAASKAGIKSGDKIISFNSQEVSNYFDFISKINRAKGEKVKLGILRDKEKINLDLTSEYNEGAEKWQIGVMLSAEQELETEKVRHSIIDSIVLGTKENIKILFLVFEILKKLVTFDLSYKVLGGPVIIAKASAAAATAGVANFMYFLAFLSLQLGILNLLPIPVLDGGHLVFLTIEAIRRKPLGLKFRQTAAQVGFFILITLMLLVTWNDVNRLFGVGKWLAKIF